jgi:hypothetical protein
MAIKDFLVGAKDLARNPLGIIALFIVLIYGFATVLVGASGEKMLPDERKLIIWFVVIFPFVVLWTFYRLVTKHHGKLYAPTDYREDRSFLDTLRTPSPATVELRINEEVEAVAQTDAAAGLQPPQDPDRLPHPADVAMPPEDDAQPSMGQRALPTIRSEVLAAEELGVAKVEQELGKLSVRQVEFIGAPGVIFDGAKVTDDEIVLVEVKFVRSAIPSAAFFRETVLRAMLVKDPKKKRAVRLVLVVVSALREALQQRLRTRVESAVFNSALPVDLKIYDLSQLRTEFGAPQ